LKTSPAERRDFYAVCSRKIPQLRDFLLMLSFSHHVIASYLLLIVGNIIALSTLLFA
jgi:hypothetical protein